MRYWAFCEEVKLKKVCLVEDGAQIIFRLPMPKSWSKKKRAEFNGKYHKQKPDLSNLLKAIEDAVMADDSAISSYRSLEKRWAETGSIEIKG